MRVREPTATTMPRPITWPGINEAMSEIRTFEILGHAYSSFLPPRVTHGRTDFQKMEALGYDEVTIETFGNVWTRSNP